MHVDGAQSAQKARSGRRFKMHIILDNVTDKILQKPLLVNIKLQAFLGYWQIFMSRPA